MFVRLAAVATLGLALVAGCSTTPSLNADPVTVSGTVLLPNGKPAGNVLLNFLPTSSAQMQGSAQLKADGKYEAKLTPGKYTFAFEGSPAALKAIPANYHSNDTANTIEVPSGGLSNQVISLTN